MIILNEVAQKLQNILNGSDTEVAGLQRPVDFQFVVATQGFHLDKIADRQTGKNFIPVFIGSMGGDFNAIPDLLEENISIPVSIYFPVRFKDDFFALNEYIAKYLVGRYLTYGTTSGKAVSNISVAKYGELENLDLTEFQTWVQNLYQQEISVRELWMSMEFTLYLSSIDSKYFYGNEATISLKTTASGTEYFPTFAEASIQSTSEPAGQQLLGENESEGLPVNTAYGSSFTIYYQKDASGSTFYSDMLTNWFNGNSQTMQYILTITLNGISYSRTCYIQSVNMVVEKGEPITITFTFNKKVS